MGIFLGILIGITIIFLIFWYTKTKKPTATQAINVNANNPAPTTNSSNTSGNNQPVKQKSGLGWSIFWAIVILLIILLVVFSWYRNFTKKDSPPTRQQSSVQVTQEPNSSGDCDVPLGGIVVRFHPYKTSITVTGEVKFEMIGDPSKWFTVSEKQNGKTRRGNALNMPKTFCDYKATPLTPSSHMSWYRKYQ